jgi:alpha-L-rhamnosidase
VGNNVLSPAVSQLGKRSLIVTYDITPYLKTGTNELLLWIGTGWYKKTTFGTAHNGALVKAQLDVRRKGGWQTLVTTDASWKGIPTGYRDTDTWQALRFGGERIDANLIPTDLKPQTLAGLSWRPVAVVDVPTHLASPEMTEPNTIQETITPQSIRRLNETSWLIDMGKSVVGWFQMSLPPLSKGDEIVLEYTDMIDKDVFQDQKQRDIYIASGAGNELFRNRFNYHAFRYVRISNLSAKPEDIKAHLIHGDFRSISSFECSDPDLNAIHDMIQYTMRNLTLGGYMVDCPHLERAGYGGDGNSSTEALQLMYGVSPLYTNWLQAWSDVMREGGSLPHVAPNPGAGGGGPYWCGFIVMAPWRTYLNYGDPRLIERYYDAMKQWLGYVDQYTKDGLLQRWPDTPYRDWYLGDWLAPAGVDSGNKASIDLVNNCFVSQCLTTLSKIAQVLGKPEEAARFSQRRDELNILLHHTFYHPETHTYATGSQLDMSYPMLTGVTPPALYNQVKQQLIALTKERHNDHIAVGLVGVPILTEWAIKSQAVDLIYSMLKKRDYPGYLYMIDNGATTTWEYWNGERSRIHNCYNGIGTWFYKALGGIVIDEENPAYKHVYINPQIPQGVTWAKTSIDSPYGKIAVDWSIKSTELTLDITLPTGCSATFILPDNARRCVINEKKMTGEKQYKITNETNHITIELASN